MVIHSNKTTKISTPGSTIWDYPMPKEDLGISRQILDGRGPQQGRYLNKVCHEIYFITGGSAIFHINNTKYDVKENDVVIIAPNTPHYIKAKNLKYITITRPNWYEAQYQEVQKRKS